MKEIKTNFIEKVIDIMRDNELTEVILEDEGNTLCIKTDGISSKVEMKNEEDSINKIEELKEEEKPNKKVIPIVSNMIGLFFSKPSPDKEPFVKVGDRVEKGQQVCIIETIKLMNKIVSDVSGTVKEICIEDSKPVEYGQTIMVIEQD